MKIAPVCLLPFEHFPLWATLVCLTVAVMLCIFDKKDRLFA